MAGQILGVYFKSIIGSMLGFFRGFLTSFGRVLLSEEVTRHGTTTRFTLKWS